MDLLKNAIYQLNKKFGAAFDVRPIHSSGADGYRLDAEAVTIDALTFEAPRSAFFARAVSVDSAFGTAASSEKGCEEQPPENVGQPASSRSAGFHRSRNLTMRCRTQ